ncbi:MAG: hypothetical protein QME60_01595 [Verrucomicrobiota bacterium]|nr:hypothetical protein [Verrucomicrobiota bacterium]
MERAIILEDDCLPDPSFFRFCEELLDRYGDDNRVMHIGGCNFQDGKLLGKHSYYFSRYCHVWGWATWRRAWRAYDVAMSKWHGLRSTDWLSARLGDPGVVDYWRKVFDCTVQGAVDTWDYQWVFACWQNGGVAATPNANLVANLGLNEGGTHFDPAAGARPAMRLDSLSFPLRHPPAVLRDNRADRHTEAFHYGIRFSKGYKASMMRLVSRAIGRLLE